MIIKKNISLVSCDITKKIIYIYKIVFNYIFLINITSIDRYLPIFLMDILLKFYKYKYCIPNSSPFKKYISTKMVTYTSKKCYAYTYY